MLPERDNVHDTPWELKNLVEESEKALVLGHYDESKTISNKVLCELQQAPEESSLKERAAIVFVQSVFETLNFAKAKSVLCSSFASLDQVPANAILLWISLALETEDRRQADSLILTLLKSKGSRKSGWTREQYLTLVHMYATDVLLPTLKDPSEVHLWLHRQTFIPLDPRERQFLENEVSEKALLSQQQQQHTGRFGGMSQRGHTNAPVITPMGSIAPTQRNSRDDDPSSMTKDGLSGYMSSPDKQSFFSQRTSHSFDTDPRRKNDYDLGIDLTPVELEFGSLVSGPDATKQQTPPLEDLDFLGNVQRLLFSALGMRSSLQSSQQEQQSEDAKNTSSGRWTMTTLGVAALAYLLYSSRVNPSTRKKALLMPAVLSTTSL